MQLEAALWHALSGRLVSVPGNPIGRDQLIDGHVRRRWWRPGRAASLAGAAEKPLVSSVREEAGGECAGPAAARSLPWWPAAAQQQRLSCLCQPTAGRRRAEGATTLPGTRLRAGSRRRAGR